MTTLVGLCRGELPWADLENHVVEVACRLAAPLWVAALPHRLLADLLDALFQRARDVAGDAYKASRAGECSPLHTQTQTYTHIRTYAHMYTHAGGGGVILAPHTHHLSFVETNLKPQWACVTPILSRSCSALIDGITLPFLAQSPLERRSPLQWTWPSARTRPRPSAACS